jgi:hypothetical protein
MIQWSFSRSVLAIAVLTLNVSDGAPKESQLNITKDALTGQIVVSWSGKGVLKQPDAEGRLRPVRARGNAYMVEPTQVQQMFVFCNPVYSCNMVGYVNLDLPPGLSLIANPLYYTNNTVAYWWPNAPDGAQVLKYLPASGDYEVSTFDALTGTWSNPEFEVGIGQGFFFRNTSTETIRQTFVGEVLQGTLVNPLPAGSSMKGSLIPMAGSINSVQQIPGMDGDILKLWVNDGQGGGDYISSAFSSAEGGWVPDLALGIGQGFWIEKQQAQDWVRYFSAF